MYSETYSDMHCHQQIHYMGDTLVLTCSSQLAAQAAPSWISCDCLSTSILTTYVVVLLCLQSTNAVNDLWANELKKILDKKKVMGIDQLTNKAAQKPAAGQIPDQPAQQPADKAIDKVRFVEAEGLRVEAVVDTTLQRALCVHSPT